MKTEDIKFVNHWKKKLIEWKSKERQWDKLNEIINDQKEKLQAVLKERFKLFSHEDYDLNRIYRNSEIGRELNMLLRSGMKRKKNIRIDNVRMYSWQGYDYCYVSENYGLKVPHCRYSYDPLDKIDGISYIPELVNNIFTVIRNKGTKMEKIVCKVDFRELLNSSVFKFEKIMKYFEFLKRGMELRMLEYKIKKIPFRLEQKIDMVDELSRYNIFENGLLILNNLEKLDKAQIQYKKKTHKFFLTLKELESELKESNRPYKLFRKLVQ